MHRVSDTVRTGTKTVWSNIPQASPLPQTSLYRGNSCTNSSLFKFCPSDNYSQSQIFRKIFTEPSGHWWSSLNLIVHTHLAQEGMIQKRLLHMILWLVGIVGLSVWEGGEKEKNLFAERWREPENHSGMSVDGQSNGEAPPGIEKSEVKMHKESEHRGLMTDWKLWTWPYRKWLNRRF